MIPMKQFEFTQNYQGNKKGDVIDMDLKIYHKFIHPLLKRGVLKVINSDKVIREEVKEVVNEPTKEEADVSLALRKRKMGDLRRLGGPYNAKDTSKEELVEEIIEMVPPDKIKTFLESD